MYKFDVIEGTYDAVANNLLVNITNGLVMHGSVNVSNKTIQELLVSEDRQIMECRCCNDFFRRYGNLLAISKSGEIKSALFRDVPNVSKEARMFFNLIADEVEEGVPVDFISRQSNIWKGNTVGFVERGNNPHFHGFIPHDYRWVKENYNFHEISQAIVNLNNTHNGIENLLRAVTEFNKMFQLEDDIPTQPRNHLANIQRMLQIIHDTTLDSSDKNFSVIAAILVAHDTLLLRKLDHFASTELYRAIEVFARTGDYETAVSTWLKETNLTGTIKTLNVSIAELRDANKMTEKKLLDAKKYLEDSGIMGSLIHKLATREDIETLWRCKDEVVEQFEAIASGDKASDLFTVAAIERSTKDNKVGINDQSYWPSPRSISRNQFINVIVPDAESIMINLPSTAHMGYITTPENKEPAEVFFWQKYNPKRPYVTVVDPHDPIPVGVYNLSAGWTEVSGVAEMPWYREDGNVPNANLPNGWLLLFDFIPAEEQRFGTLSSYGGLVHGELNRHLRAIDTVIGNRSTEVKLGETYQSFLALHKGREIKQLRVIHKDGTRRQYAVLDID